MAGPTTPFGTALADAGFASLSGIGLAASNWLPLPAQWQAAVFLLALVSTLLATWLSLGLCLANTAFYTSMCPKRRWVQIAIRVLAAWAARCVSCCWHLPCAPVTWCSRQTLRIAWSVVHQPPPLPRGLVKCRGEVKEEPARAGDTSRGT